MDSERAAFPRNCYPDRVINFKFRMLGEMYKEGIYDGVKYGLRAAGRKNNGFDHFGMGFSLENEKEFDGVVNKQVDFVRSVMGI